jgi:hypothetical protein
MVSSDFSHGFSPVFDSTCLIPAITSSYSDDRGRSLLFHLLLSQHSDPPTPESSSTVLSRFFPSSLAFATLSAARLSLVPHSLGSPNDAAGFTLCYGLLFCTSFRSDAYSALTPPVTRKHQELATWLSGNYHDRTCTG